MTRRLISSGSTFEEQIGYSRAVVDGDWVHVAGTTGFDYATMTIADDVVEQAEQASPTSPPRWREAGASFADVVRVRYLLPDRADFEPCWPVLRRAFGDGPPGRDDAGLRPLRPADADRDRGHRAPPSVSCGRGAACPPGAALASSQIDTSRRACGHCGPSRLGRCGHGEPRPRGRRPAADRADRAGRLAGADPLRECAAGCRRHHRSGGGRAGVVVGRRRPRLTTSRPRWPSRSFDLAPGLAADFPEDIAVQRRVPYEARADAIMYRQELAELAHARGWDVHLYDAKAVEAQAASVLRTGRRGPAGPRATLGPPWTKDHRVALAATIVAG